MLLSSSKRLQSQEVTQETLVIIMWLKQLSLYEILVNMTFFRKRKQDRTLASILANYFWLKINVAQQMWLLIFNCLHMGVHFMILMFLQHVFRLSICPG